MNEKDEIQPKSSALKEALILIGLVVACVLVPYLLSQVFKLF